MKRFRPCVFTAAILLLFVSACSTPDDLITPTLEPQFGGPDYDSASSVSANVGHPYIFVAGRRSPVTNTDTVSFFLRRYNRDGSFAWERRSPFASAEDYTGGDVTTDAAGNAYFSYGSLSGFGTEASGAPANFLSKLSKSGTLLWRRDLDKDGSVPAGRRATLTDALTSDNAGNTYVSVASVTTDLYLSGSLRKYSTNGRLLWERVVGDTTGERIVDLAVAADGTLYAASFIGGRANFLTKYSPDGAVLWRVEVSAAVDNLSDVAVGGGAVYVGATAYLDSSNTALLKYSTEGDLEWERDIGSSDSYDLDADTAGNAYVTRNVNGDLGVRRYTPAGDVGWVYQPRLAGTRESASAVDARSSSEVYAVGGTDGKVNGINNGNTDAFLLRLNGQGSKVWSR